MVPPAPSANPRHPPPLTTSSSCSTLSFPRTPHLFRPAPPPPPPPPASFSVRLSFALSRTHVHARTSAGIPFHTPADRPYLRSAYVAIKRERERERAGGGGKENGRTEVERSGGGTGERKDTRGTESRAARERQGGKESKRGNGKGEGIRGRGDDRRGSEGAVGRSTNMVDGPWMSGGAHGVTRAPQRAIRARASSLIK